MKSFLRLIVLLVLTAASHAASHPALAADSPDLGISGPTPARQSFDPPLKIGRGQELTITGENTSDQPVLLVLRADDGQSTSYSTRVDEERMVPPGKFRLRFTPAQWKTPSGRQLDSTDIRLLIVFTGDGQPALDIAKATTEKSFELPAGAFGWKFGPGGGAVFPGFEGVIANDPRLSGASQLAVNRPSADGLIGSGLKGVERFEAPLPNGRWNVALWTEDIGEWELLPHPLERRIRVNGIVAEDVKRTPEQWVRDVYLAGRDREALADGDAWDVFGRRRGGLISVTVDVTDGKLVVEQSGDGTDATFLSAILAEPAGSHKALQAVQAARRERFHDRWPQMPVPGAPLYTGPLAVALMPDGTVPAANWRPSKAALAPQARPVARGGTAILDFVAIASDDRRHVDVSLSPPVFGGKALPGDLRWGQWRFMRREASGQMLLATADHLRGDMAAMTLRKNLPRRINLVVPIPEGTAPGIYHGTIMVSADGDNALQPFSIEVLPVTLPPADRPIGVYLEEPPFFGWFDVPDADRDRAEMCDLTFLSRLGLTGIAPGFVTPTADQAVRFAQQVQMVRAAGFRSRPLAYAQLKRLIAGVGIDNITAPLAAADKALGQRGVASPIWSIADEPGNPGSMPDDLRKMRTLVQLAMPNAKVAGHLNHPQDRALLPLFDVVLLNTGFGIDGDELIQMRLKGTEPWLYNMPDIEEAAGFFQWRSGAQGYLQWHGRLPTADPFDPTDGRESDFMLLPITEQACLAVPDVDYELLRMVRGIQDLRWMLWLEDKAHTDQEAAMLLDKIRDAVPKNWSGFARLPIDLQALRGQLIDLARKTP